MTECIKIYYNGDSFKELGDTKLNINQAKKYIRELGDNNLSYHFDESALEVLYKTHNKITKEQATEIEVTIDKIYACDFDWGKHGCPIGYALSVWKENK